MVSAWANASRLVLGHRKVDDKSNAITAIPKLLKMLELEGAIVTIDAIGCQTEMARTIIEQGADDVLARKDNQATLHGKMQLYFDDVKTERLAHVSYAHHSPIDADHGRLQTRHYWLTADIECFDVKKAWAQITPIGLVESHIEVGGSLDRAALFLDLACL